MSKIEVNTVAPQCGTTLTLGESGDTVTLGTGASQSGFGRTGTVDWQTGDIKTGTFTAADGKGYFINTTSGGVTVNLPAGAAGTIVSFSDYARTWDDNAVTVTPNGSEKIGGIAGDASLNTEGQSVTFLYQDSTQGWINIQDSTSAVTGASFMVATVSGSCNTLTTSGNCKIAKFVGPGTFTVCSVGNPAANNEVSYMVVAGGGGGGKTAGGGGGAGGFRETKSPVTPYTASPLDGQPSAPNRITVTATGFPITVGGGGAGATSAPTPGASGGVSTFSTITSAGGGGGGSDNASSCGAAGGSGGGPRANLNKSGGAGNTPPVSPPQGNPGGNTGSPPYPGCNAAGGGGATQAGINSVSGTPSPTMGDGGTGATTEISASPVAYAGGGGGPNNNPGPAGDGGTGGGGDGAGCGQSESAGTVNTGGGGGGGKSPSCGNAGGSGIVIIRYKFQ